MPINKSTRKFTLGLTSAYQPTSTYVTFGKAPGVGAIFSYEVLVSTSATPVDFRILRSLDSESSNFTFASTTFTAITSSFPAATTKAAHTFAFQAKQSTSTTTVGNIQVRWISVG